MFSDIDSPPSVPLTCLVIPGEKRIIHREISPLSYRPTIDLMAERAASTSLCRGCPATATCPPERARVLSPNAMALVSEQLCQRSFGIRRASFGDEKTIGEVVPKSISTEGALNGDEDAFARVIAMFDADVATVTYPSVSDLLAPRMSDNEGPTVSRGRDIARRSASMRPRNQR
jgi:hypothetical protein